MRRCKANGQGKCFVTAVVLMPQGLYSSLELLPLYSGVDPDVEIFASGCVQEDGGDWSGGVPLNDVSAGGNDVPTGAQLPPATNASSAPAAGAPLSSRNTCTESPPGSNVLLAGGQMLPIPDASSAPASGTTLRLSSQAPACTPIPTCRLADTFCQLALGAASFRCLFCSAAGAALSSETPVLHHLHHLPSARRVLPAGTQMKTASHSPMLLFQRQVLPSKECWGLQVYRSPPAYVMPSGDNKIGDFIFNHAFPPTGSQPVVCAPVTKPGVYGSILPCGSCRKRTPKKEYMDRGRVNWEADRLRE